MNVHFLFNTQQGHTKAFVWRINYMFQEVNKYVHSLHNSSKTYQNYGMLRICSQTSSADVGKRCSGNCRKTMTGLPSDIWASKNSSTCTEWSMAASQRRRVRSFNASAISIGSDDHPSLSLLIHRIHLYHADMQCMGFALANGRFKCLLSTKNRTPPDVDIYTGSFNWKLLNKNASLQDNGWKRSLRSWQLAHVEASLSRNQQNC